MKKDKSLVRIRKHMAKLAKKILSDNFDVEDLRNEMLSFLTENSEKMHLEQFIVEINTEIQFEVAVTFHNDSDVYHHLISIYIESYDYPKAEYQKEYVDEI